MWVSVIYLSSGSCERRGVLIFQMFTACLVRTRTEPRRGSDCDLNPVLASSSASLRLSDTQITHIPVGASCFSFHMSLTEGSV